MDFLAFDINELPEIVKFGLMLLAAGAGSFLLEMYREWRQSREHEEKSRRTRDVEFQDDILNELAQLREREQKLMDRADESDGRNHELREIIHQKNRLILKLRLKLERVSSENERLKRRLESRDTQSRS